MSAGRHHRVKPGPVGQGPSPARRRGLEVFRHTGEARESNITQDSGASSTVYWQTRAWLSQQGFITHTGRNQVHRITAAGLEYCERHGIPTNHPAETTKETTMPKTETATVSRLDRGECPTCGLNVALRKGGLTREHTHQGAKCAGSGEQAKIVDALPAPSAAELTDDDAKTLAERITAAAGTPGFDAEVAHQAASERTAAGDRPSEAAMAGATAGRKAAAKKAATVEQVRTGSGATLMRLPLDDFEPNPANPRTNMGTDEDLAELGASIATRGLVEPIVGYRRDDGKVELIAGGRRLEAARRNGTVDALDVLIREGDTEADRRELALIENAMRKDLEPLEEARAFQALIDDFGYTQLGLGERLGRSQGHVSRRLSLLKLPEPIQAAVGTKLGVRDAEELAKQPAKVAEAAWSDLKGHSNPDEMHRQLPGALREVKARQELERKNAAATKKLKADGVRIVDSHASWDGAAGEGVEDLQNLENDQLGLTPDEAERIFEGDLTRDQVEAILAEKHAGCAGHAARIYKGEITYVCTNPADLHPMAAPAPKANTAADKARKEAERFAKARNATTAQRLLVMKDLLAKRISAAATVHVITAYLETQDANYRNGLYGLPPEATRAMTDLLGYEVSRQSRWTDMLEVAVPERGLFTVALALSLAAGDRELLTYDEGDDTIAPATARHLRFLRDEAGYKLADWETEALTAADEQVDDDTPHQVDAASIDTWEDPEPPAAADTEAIAAAALEAEQATEPA